MKLESQIATALQNALKHLYHIDIEADPALVQPTRKGFTGDLTVVVFPWVKVARKSPDALGAEIGQQLLENLDCIQDFNVVKGYLNLQIKESFWMDLLEQESDNEGYGLNPTQEEAPVLIEYSSPNTNRPLHLGPAISATTCSAIPCRRSSKRAATRWCRSTWSTTAASTSASRCLRG